MQVFEESYVIAGSFGNMDNLGMTVATYIIWLLRRASNIGRGTTVAWILFLIVILFTVLNRFILKRMEKLE
jgi:cellobiose transport system permease protein